MAGRLRGGVRAGRRGFGRRLRSFGRVAQAEAILEALGPRAQAAPLAGRRKQWSRPAEILGEGVPVLAQHAVRKLRHRGGRVVEAEVVAPDRGAVVSAAADTFVDAAGGIRTPALLAASGIDGEPFAPQDELPVRERMVVEVAAEGVVPRSGPVRRRPDGRVAALARLLLCDSYDASVLEGHIDDSLLLGLYWYTLMEPRRENRIVFGRATDAVGLPQPTFEYALEQADRDRLQAALGDLRAAGALLGTFLPTSQPQMRAPGSSMHLMGTTGETDDGESVVDPTGRVWGFENLYLGGTGVVPCATAADPTLAVCAFAARAADRILAR